MLIVYAPFPKTQKGRSISDYRDRTALLLGLMVYDYATRYENTCSGISPPFAGGKGKHTPPIKDITRNTACSLCCAPTHYESGSFNIDAHDKGTRLENILIPIKHL